MLINRCVYSSIPSKNQRSCLVGNYMPSAMLPKDARGTWWTGSIRQVHCKHMPDRMIKRHERPSWAIRFGHTAPWFPFCLYSSLETKPRSLNPTGTRWKDGILAQWCPGCCSVKVSLHAGVAKYQQSTWSCRQPGVCDIPSWAVVVFWCFPVDT